ncbi:MAG: hypothetical protein JNL36_10405 [Candidatus Kapabacteria bacterium]|nr:hypothetical protein [Candidatus Kapabacteria bacterium]
MKIYIISIIVFLTSFTGVFCQWDNNIVCPGDSSNCEWRETVPNRRVQLSFKFDQFAFVTYRYRYCNGVLEIDILSVSTVDNAGFLREFKMEHYEFASLRSSVELGLMQDHWVQRGHDSLPWIRNSTTGCIDSVTWVNFFTASCGIFLECNYAIVGSSTRNCDRGYTPPYPESILYPGCAVYTKWQKCGYNCCKKTYKVCTDVSSTDPEAGNSESRSLILRIKETKITSVTDCSLQSKYGSKPCYTNCWNNP